MDSKPAVGKAKNQSIFPLGVSKEGSGAGWSRFPWELGDSRANARRLLKSLIKKQLLRFLPQLHVAKWLLLPKLGRKSEVSPLERIKNGSLEYGTSVKCRSISLKIARLSESLHVESWNNPHSPQALSSGPLTRTARITPSNQKTPRDFSGKSDQLWGKRLLDDH